MQIIYFQLLFIILHTSVFPAYPMQQKENKQNLFTRSFFLGIDYYILSIATKGNNNARSYQYQANDYFAAGPCLYYVLNGNLHFSFTPYYCYNSSIIKFNQDYLTLRTTLYQDEKLHLKAHFLIPAFLVKWRIAQNCCSFGFCQEPVGLLFISGIAYRTLLSEEEEKGFTLHRGSFPYLITGFSINFFNLKNILLFYNLKAEFPVFTDGLKIHPANFHLLNFSLLYKI